jgi:phenylalanyl-tRNA synthetase alpha chain
VPADHVSRSPNDTYYVNPDTVLRCHTSAHQTELLRGGHPGFLVTGEGGGAAGGRTGGGREEAFVH